MILGPYSVTPGLLLTLLGFLIVQSDRLPPFALPVRYRRAMLIRRGGESWKEPTVTSYSDEQKLQELIAEAPHLLPGSTGALAVVRELPVSSGYIDILGVDPVGQVVLCECKLDANADSRRKVVGQLLAYAGAIWELDFETFKARFFDRAGKSLFDFKE